MDAGIGWPTPVHCPPRNDGRRWISHDLNPMGHSNTVHNSGTEMTAAFWSWLELSVQALRRMTVIAPSALPDPNDPARKLDLGLLDPTTVAVVIGYAQQHKREAPAAYIGLVVQQPHTLWRSLTGFYLLWCPACDPDGDQTFRQLRQRLASHKITLKWIGDLHPALQPKPGWFDDGHGGRLIYGAHVNANPDLSSAWRTESELTTAGRTAALIATTPPVLDTSTLVLVEDLVRDTPTLRALSDHIGRWSFRGGTNEALEQLAGLTPSTPPRTSTATHPAAIPATWGVWAREDEPTVHGPVPNLWKTLRPAFPTPQRGDRPTFKIAHLTPRSPIRLTDIEALTLALSLTTHPRVIKK